MSDESRSERQRSTERAYDSVARDFAVRTVQRSEMAADFFERFLATLPANALVADLGCGPGHDLGRMLAAGHRPLGVDRSAGLLGLCPTGSAPVRGDLMTLPFQTKSVDGIWSSAALLHVDAADLAETFVEWNRVLIGGGVLGFATSLAGGEQDHGWELVPGGPERRPEIHDDEQRWFVHHAQHDLIEALTDAGFSVAFTDVRASHRNWVQVLAYVLKASG